MKAGGGDFFMIPNAAVDRRVLEKCDFAVLASVARHRNTVTNESFVGVATIAIEASVSRPTVIQSIRQLCELGFITVRVDTNSHSQRHIYSFPMFEDTQNRSNELTGQGSEPVKFESKTGKKHRVKPVKPVDPNKNKNKTKNKITLAKREVDPRSALFKDAIFAYFAFKNPRMATPPWDASDATRLKSMLAANPNIEIEDFRGLLNNRARSDVNHSERPRKWIADVTRYTSALDRFGQPKGAPNGNSNGSHGKGDRNLAVLSEFVTQGHDRSPLDVSGDGPAGVDRLSDDEDLFGRAESVAAGRDWYGHKGSCLEAAPRG